MLHYTLYTKYHFLNELFRKSKTIQTCETNNVTVSTLQNYYIMYPLCSVSTIKFLIVSYIYKVIGTLLSVFYYWLKSTLMRSIASFVSLLMFVFMTWNCKKTTIGLLACFYSDSLRIICP